MDTRGKIASAVTDRDSLHILSLSAMPIKARPLQRTRIMKNSHLESVLEVFSGDEMGAGHVSAKQVSSVFTDISAEDIEVIKRLADMPSYDVFNLRNLVKRAGWKLKDDQQLKLSKGKQADLETHMLLFIRPLLSRLYSNGVPLRNDEELFDAFLNQDHVTVRKKIRGFAGALGLEPDIIPRLILDSAELFRAANYYRQCLDDLRPVLFQFEQAVGEINDSNQLQGAPSTRNRCLEIGKQMSRHKFQVGALIDNIDRDMTNLWEISDGDEPPAFHSTAQGSQPLLGRILCGLQVKMDSWTKKFPDRQAGSPRLWSEYIINEIQQGLERIKP